MSIFASDFSSSTARCGTLPGPDVTKFNAPGFAFAMAIRSATFLAGEPAFTASNSGTRATSVTGLRSTVER